MLDVVKLGELPAVVGRNELLKFFQRLVAEISSIDEKENASRAGEFNQPINQIGSGVCLAAASRHLHKRAALVFGNAFSVLAGLFFDTDERVALRLCFDGPDYLFVSEEEIICLATL